MVGFSTTDGNTNAYRVINTIPAGLAVEDAEAFESLTAEKLAGLCDVQADVAAENTPPRAPIESARAIDADATLRARANLVSVENRFASIQTTAGKPAPMIYGGDGLWAG